MEVGEVIDTRSKRFRKRTGYHYPASLSFRHDGFSIH
nr:MAG TPA: hypothetical protein [Caudoviricetes sp.]